MRIKSLARLLCIGTALVNVSAGQSRPDALEQVLDRISSSEKDFVSRMREYSPMLETYIQETAESGRPGRDHYFLGRLSITNGLSYTDMAARSGDRGGSGFLGLRKRSMTFVPAGFAQMIFPDADEFSARAYVFRYVRREFLGDVRTLVFDVTPAEKDSPGRFVGRLWVEDREFHIVRFNGTYTKASASHMYFHFDSWRVNVAPGLWVPAYIYVEEAGDGERKRPLRAFKAQTRLWGYLSAQSSRMDELTTVLIDSASSVDESETARDVSPLESQRSWERQAEDNVLERLEKGGLLAPKGEVDRVLTTVLNNLAVTNNLPVEARARVLLTTPLETFSVGRTIVISRGLLDVLPDEASLAMVLSDELAHIALGHRTKTQFAFINETMLSDEEVLQRFRFSRTPEETKAAGERAIALLEASPYKGKMNNAGLFLRALSSRAPVFPNLIRANLGNQLASGGTLTRLTGLADRAPALDEQKLDQLAALPLGSRIKVDPWTGSISMLPGRPVSLVSAREKLSFELTPFLIHLTRSPGGGDTAGGID